ncbi:MAG: ABC transporter permease [Myxococcota bacterium]
MRDGRGPHPLVELIRVRLLEHVRDPAALFWVFGFPVLLAISLGVAFRDEAPEPVRAGVGAEAPGAERLEAILGFVDRVEAVVLPSDALSTALDEGGVDVVVSLLGEDRVRYRYDPTRPDSRVARFVVDDAVQRGLGREDVAAVEVDTRVAPGSRYIDFLLPALIGLNLMGSSMWSIGYDLVQARRRRLLRVLAVSPMRRSHFLAAHGLSRLAFVVLEVSVLTLFGWLALDVRLQGSIVDLLGLSMLGAMSFAGLALLVAARTSSVEVVSGLMNLVMMPMWLLSGVFFTWERFPEVFHPVIRALPLTALNDALRAVYHDGAGLLGVLPEVGILAAWGVVGFAVALRTFRWQ